MVLYKNQACDQHLATWSGDAVSTLLWTGLCAGSRAANLSTLCVSDNSIKSHPRSDTEPMYLLLFINYDSNTPNIFTPTKVNTGCHTASENVAVEPSGRLFHKNGWLYNVLLSSWMSVIHQIYISDYYYLEVALHANTSITCFVFTTTVWSHGTHLCYPNDGDKPLAQGSMSISFQIYQTDICIWT